MEPIQVGHHYLTRSGNKVKILNLTYVDYVQSHQATYYVSAVYEEGPETGQQFLVWGDGEFAGKGSGTKTAEYEYDLVASLSSAHGHIQLELF